MSTGSTPVSFSAPIFDAHADRIAAFLAEHGPGSVYDIRTALDIPEGSVRNVLTTRPWSTRFAHIATVGRRRQKVWAVR